VADSSRETLRDAWSARKAIRAAMRDRVDYTYLAQRRKRAPRDQFGPVARCGRSCLCTWLL